MVADRSTVMLDMRVEGKYFMFRDNGNREFILLPSGTDKRGRRQYTEYRVFDGKLPYNQRDWKPINGTATAPNGYVWYSNGKSPFSKEYDTALLRRKENE